MLDCCVDFLLFASPAHDCRAGLSQQERHTCNVSLSRRHTPLGWCGKCPAYATAVASARPCRAVRQEYMASAVQAFIINNCLSHQAPSAQRRTHAVRPPPALTASVAFHTFQAEMADSGTTPPPSPHSPCRSLPSPPGDRQVKTRLSSDGVWSLARPDVPMIRPSTIDGCMLATLLSSAVARVMYCRRHSCLADTR